MRRRREPPVGLTVGSSDSGGGAGIQGDIKAFASVGCFAATVVVGVTAQNTTGVANRLTVPVGFVLEQLEAVLSDLPVDAVKVGTSWSAAHVVAIADRLSRVDVPIVVDPVMVTAAGAALADPGVVPAVVERLFPVAEVVTPNLAEARLLCGADAGSPRATAERLVELGARAVVVTCGGAGDHDWFADAATSVPIPRPRHDSGAEHGAGCAHSALIAGFRARGIPLRTSIELATEKAARAVRKGLVSIGHGTHPVDVIGLAEWVVPSGAAW
ncbi:MAG TPA: bifunctional hydroxymethylpyrimidine kinase/phosphomethylpyrimidine kinase [Actinophytocola sp.]|uniref:bifunctional hydroxymethylpyrimidine kinase/phosphomethylpyrimidine kinase n=1 Tax=Actinophytocola sp. TaxID=1872138 RepID=UPI002DDD6539|nr:bifunctional hydroxymethylpyrimidine kinase/phosphomethylpyrimidine kinase [Actinophytocola sp.]HEV2778226.1 bifunctional hydroxymethylpyrimidine kinase/phosphomethylpyrimidine kinase [Actinophytocola sp.]